MPSGTEGFFRRPLAVGQWKRLPVGSPDAISPRPFCVTLPEFGPALMLDLIFIAIPSGARLRNTSDLGLDRGSAHVTRVDDVRMVPSLP